MKLATVCVVFPVLLAALPAQKMPLDGDASRALQMFDVADLLGGAGKGPDLDPTNRPPSPPEVLELASFLGRFLEPPLQAGDDARILGGRWLAVLGKPGQLASAERLLAAARARRKEHTVTTAHLIELKQASFAAQVDALLPKAAAGGKARSAVLTKQVATGLIEQVIKGDDANVLHAPRVLSAPLDRVAMSVGDNVHYVKDFAVKATDGRFVAEPVTDTIFDGIQIDLLVTFTGKDRVGMQCAVLQQKVEKPIPEFATTIGGSTVPVKLQLPRTTGVRLQHTAELELGNSVIIAAQKSDGAWLVAVVEVDRSPQ